MEQFASGLKEHYYGKGDVIVYRLRRDGQVPEGMSPMFGANVLMLVYGGSFWPTYAMGDNTGLIATDSMKNFIQRETLGFTGQGFEDYCRFLGQKFLDLYPQVEGIQVTAEEIPYTAIGGPALVPSGPDRAHARIELNRERTIEVTSGLPRIQAVAAGRQHVLRFPPRRVHDAARHQEPGAPHVARPEVELHVPGAGLH